MIKKKYYHNIYNEKFLQNLLEDFKVLMQSFNERNDDINALYDKPKVLLKKFNSGSGESFLSFDQSDYDTYYVFRSPDMTLLHMLWMKIKNTHQINYAYCSYCEENITDKTYKIIRMCDIYLGIYIEDFGDNNVIEYELWVGNTLINTVIINKKQKYHFLSGFGFPVILISLQYQDAFIKFTSNVPKKFHLLGCQLEHTMRKRMVYSTLPFRRYTNGFVYQHGMLNTDVRHKNNDLYIKNPSCSDSYIKWVPVVNILSPIKPKSLPSTLVDELLAVSCRPSRLAQVMNIETIKEFN